MSLADRVNSVLLISNKKQSRIGIVLFEFKTPPMDFKCFKRRDAEITKFINLILKRNYAKHRKIPINGVIVLNYFLTELLALK
jgi:NAD(P)H-dependent flavin oxidoreductase YrpB (nitropropane dioxygenase family)